MSEYPPNSEYGKLVRDRIPEIIEADGLSVETRELTSEETLHYLKIKAVEEAKELAEAKGIDEIKKEMSDVLEILQSLADRLEINMSEIEDLRLKRANSRGRFKDGIYLVKTWKDEE